MDPHGAGQLESNHRRVDNILNNKWPDELGGQFIGLHPQWKVLGREPHLLAYPVSGGSGTMAVGSRRVPVCSSSESGPGPDEGLNRRAGGFLFQSWEQQHLEAVSILEGGESCGGAG